MVAEPFLGRRERIVKKHVLSCSSFAHESWLASWKGDGTIWFDNIDEDWEKQQSQLVDWLLSLPKPVAIMACNDDSLLCEICDPALSSIVPNAELIGYCGAELLAQEMAGEIPKQRKNLIDPIGITHRMSTNTYAVETELPIDHIAMACGYEHPEYLHVVFRRELNMTPGEYRRINQS